MPADGTLNLARGSEFDRWMTAALRDAAQAAPPPDPGRVVVEPELEPWTPKLAGEAFVSALKWARYNAGATGPSGIRSGQPAYLPTAEEYLEDWGEFPAGDDEAPPSRIMPSPAQISRHLAALEWPAVYLVGEGRQGSARMLGLWAACKAYRRNFAGAVKDRGIARSMAYDLRDRGLSLIAVGLTRDGVPVAVE